jgi:chitinase
VADDAVDERDETLTVELVDAVGVDVSQPRATGTITDDDPAPAVRIADVRAAEGTGGQTTMLFALTLSRPSDQPVSVRARTFGGTATSPTDLTWRQSVVTVPAGTTTATFSVAVNGDAVREPNENFTVRLDAPVGLTIADGTGTGTILNDD